MTSTTLSTLTKPRDAVGACATCPARETAICCRVYWKEYDPTAPDQHRLFRLDLSRHDADVLRAHLLGHDVPYSCRPLAAPAPLERLRENPMGCIRSALLLLAATVCALACIVLLLCNLDYWAILAFMVMVACLLGIKHPWKG